MKKLLYLFTVLCAVSCLAQTGEHQFVVSEGVLTNELKKEINDLKSRHIPLYEDEKYVVRKTCGGEWGGSVWFKNKSTGIEYSADATCPVSVNKLDSKYYVTASLAHLTGSCRVLEISEPDSMAIFKMPPPRSKKGRKKLYYVGDGESNSEKGTKTLSEKYGLLAKGSFLYHDELYHIVGTHSRLFVAKIQDQEFSEVKVITTEDTFTYDDHIVRTKDGHLMIPIKAGYLDVFENRIVILRPAR